jgi:zinc-binding alcohol dehydrogenase/oxidoreductase
MLEFVEGHKLLPVIDKIFPLEQVKEAFAHMEAANQFGKIILQIS